MKKIFSLFLIASALILSSCEKDTITTYVTQTDETISVRFQAYGPSPLTLPASLQEVGTAMSDTGIEQVYLSGGGYSNAVISPGNEVKLSEGTVYDITWQYFNTSATLIGRVGSFTLNYINNPNSITIYLGDDDNEIVRREN
jgi:PBP1b-binding outer membrane lipoprotein LpoB